VRLAFVETATQAESAPDGYHLIALEPHAQVTLELAGRTFGRPDQYEDPDDIEQAGLANFATLERLCARIDSVLAASIPEIAARSLLPARWHFLTLKPLYDCLSLRAATLRRILARENPREVAWFERAEGSIYGSLLQILVPLAEADARVLDDLPAPPREPVGQPLAPRILRTFRHALHVLPGGRRRRAKGLSVLCADNLYNVPPIARELRRLGHQVLLLPGRRADEGLTELEVWHVIEADAEIRSAFVWDGVDYWAAAAPRLRALLEPGVVQVLADAREALDALTALAPDALLTSVAAYPREKAICHAARTLGIPSIVSRHGELGLRESPMAAFQDLDAVDHALCWGAFEQAWVERHATRSVRTEVVGAPMIEAVARTAPARHQIREELGIAPNELVVLYVPTGLSGDDWYAGRRSPTDSAYFQQQVATVRALVDLGTHRVVVKDLPYHERPTPLDRWCAALAEVDFRYEPGFSRLINLADAVVLDAPSTTLIEALFGDGAVYLIDDPVLGWEPGVREHLVAHGVVVTDFTHLAADLGAGRSQAGYSQTVREPLIASADVSAARRAAEAVVRIASR
jgi:hypothetical protein